MSAFVCVCVLRQCMYDTCGTYAARRQCLRRVAHGDCVVMSVSFNGHWVLYSSSFCFFVFYLLKLTKKRQLPPLCKHLYLERKSWAPHGKCGATAVGVTIMDNKLHTQEEYRVPTYCLKAQQIPAPRQLYSPLVTIAAVR